MTPTTSNNTHPMTAQEKLGALLPCPFCGHDESLYVEHVEGTIRHPAYYVRCDYCGAQTGSTDKGNHVEIWNTRALRESLGGEGEAWPERMVNLPCPDGTTDRIVGFRIEEGSPILGRFGLSEPIAWLRSVTVDRTTPRPAEAAKVSLADIGLCNWAAHILSDPERFNDRANEASAAIRRLIAALQEPRRE